MNTYKCWLAAGLAMTTILARAAELYPTALLGFQGRGSEAQESAAKVTDILFASLAAKPKLVLVDRADLQKITDEMALNKSGMVTPAEAIQVGQLTGAKILLSGSVMDVGKSRYLVAKIIGTETSRVLGESVKGNVTDGLDQLAAQLAEKVAAIIEERAGELVAKPVSKDEMAAGLKKAMGNAKRPTVIVKIAERHIGQPTIDPAAETELIWFCKEAGFTVLDASASQGQADIVLKGEGFSELAGQRGNLVSVKARVEVKAVDPRTDKVIAIDRQTAVEVDLAEQVAAKAALQKAAVSIALRLLPKLGQGADNKN